MALSPATLPKRPLLGGAIALALATLAGCTLPGGTPQSYTATIPLGSERSLTALYSYPNGQREPQTLEQTIEHYLKQTTERDGIEGAVVDVTPGRAYTATITATDPSVIGYETRLPGFLDKGHIAALSTQTIQRDGKWNDKEWRFFLPLGLAMINQQSVQLLHFPPDYSLPDQDYLNSKTSQRWEDLLRANGMDEDDISLNETIVDIAPIAAPASAGKELAPTYPYYAYYDGQMLAFQVSARGGALPVVAYGGPVRDWIESTYKTGDLEVLDTLKLPISDTARPPTLIANHPSLFWYAAKDSCDGGWDVMRQDLISARWQMKMGAAPSADMKGAVTDATRYWDARHGTICELVRRQSSSCTTAPMKNCPTP